MREKDSATTGEFRQGLSLSVKIYILIIVIIVTVSAALVFTGYSVFCQKIDEEYHSRSTRAVSAASEFLVTDFLDHFWQATQSEEYRQVKQKAVAAGDQEILLQWMRKQPGLYSGLSADEQQAADPSPAQFATLYDEYAYLNLRCGEIRDLFDITDLYIQRMENGVTYTVIDPNEDLFYIGTVEDRISEFNQYGDNAYVPRTVYHSRYGWLCTSCQPIRSEGQVFGLLCVDIDMNAVMKDRNRFLVKSLIFVLIEIAFAVVVSMLLIRHSITRPLKLLAKAARNFAGNNESITKADVIQLPIRSRDEIGVLYHEIQSMESRIVDYTDHITRITAEEERTRTEMALAARIQNSALPENFDLPTKAVDLYALMTPARQVGGDFYDFFLTGPDQLCLVIADVSGKGVPSSLFMMRAKTAIKYYARSGQEPSELLESVNSALCEENAANMFVTVWLGILDLKTGIMRCCNAGHEYPAVMRAGGQYELLIDKHGMMLAIFEDNAMTGYEIRLNPGDRFFVYTDGVTEAMNEKQQQYGTGRMLEELNSLKDSDQETVLRGVLGDIRNYAGSAEQFDDITMLGLTFQGE